MFDIKRVKDILEKFILLNGIWNVPVRDRMRYT